MAGCEGIEPARFSDRVPDLSGDRRIASRNAVWIHSLCSMRGFAASVSIFPHILVWGSSFLCLIPLLPLLRSSHITHHSYHTTHHTHHSSHTTHHTPLTTHHSSHTTHHTHHSSHTTHHTRLRRRCPIVNRSRSGSVRGSGGCLVGAGRLWSGVGAGDAVPL